MDPHTHFKVLLLLLISTVISSSASSCTSPLQSGEKLYKEWISWHVNNFQIKPNAPGPSPAEKVSPGFPLDRELITAEKHKIRITVCQDGTGNFTTITQALDVVPLHNHRRVIISIKPGVYREKVVIPKTKKFVTFLGEYDGQPTITWNDTAQTARSTYWSATVAVNADYFVAVNIKFENTVKHVIGSYDDQAVALRISGNKSAFYNCSFYGDQDTLYDHKGFHYFNNCFIQGSVDFIFGNGRSFYELTNCYLRSIGKASATLTAQKRSDSSQSSGFSFKDSTVTGSGQLYLGRAWGNYSRVVFSYTYMDTLVVPQGWCDWGDPERDNKVYYGEYKCSGPGANTTGRVWWARELTDEEAMPFIGTHFIKGDSWLTLYNSTTNLLA